MQITDLRKYGMPERILNIWRDRQGETLLPVQRQAIRKGLLGIDNTRSEGLLITAPTSSGKSFCAEMAVVSALTQRRQAVLIFPLKSLAEENYRLLNDTYGPLGIRCLIATADHPENDRAFSEGDYQVAVSIYEKFDLLLRADLDILKNIGLLVIDEVQMIAEKGRGAVLERLLTTVRASSYQPELIALSAVIGNTDADRLASWLNVRLVEESARPVDLLRGVAASGSLAYRSYNSGTDDIEPFTDISLAENSADSIVDLLRSLEGSTLVFLKSRMDTVRLAFRLAAAVSWPPASTALEALVDEEPSFLARSLRQALNRAVAFHNSDLTARQRMAIEQAFANKEIRVLFSTTTLAMGVNLPAETVFLETVKYVGGDYDGRPVIVPITRAEFENMTGRAGRLGLANGKPGKAIVLAQSDFDRDILWQQYIAAGPPEGIVSVFDSIEPADWLLPMIACRLVRARQDIHSVYRHSFHAHCHKDREPDSERVLGYLMETGIVKSDRSENIEVTPFGRVSAASGMTTKQAVYYRGLLLSDQPESESAWLALALSGPDWDLPPGILSRAELADNAAVRLMYRDFEHAIDDARYILPPNHRHQPLTYRQAAVLKSMLLLIDWTRLTPAQRLEERYQIHLGQIHALGETAAHLVSGLGALLSAVDRNSPSIGRLRELTFSLRFGLSPALRELHRHLGLVLNRSDFMSLQNAGLTSIQELASGDSILGELISNEGKLLEINQILDKYKQEVSMNTSQHSVVSAAVAEPELVEIDGTLDHERYLVKINGYPVRLTGKSFKYFTKLAWSRLKRDSGWVYKEDIEVGFNQARYLYRMKNEINANLGSDWPIVENNRLGYYRLDIDPEKIRINTQNLSNHPDYEIRSLVVPDEIQPGGDNPSVH